MSGTGSDAHNAATGLAKGATDALTNTDLASGVFEAPADRKPAGEVAGGGILGSVTGLVGGGGSSVGGGGKPAGSAPTEGLGLGGSGPGVGPIGTSDKVDTDGSIQKK